MNSQTPAPETIVWFQNKFVRLAEANVSVLTHAFNYGTGVFEGIRGYYEPHRQELFLVRMIEHYERWKRNCKILRIQVPPPATELGEITAELCRRNGYRHNVYVRPLAYKAAVRLGVPIDDNDAYCITAVPFGEYLTGKKGV